MSTTPLDDQPRPQYRHDRGATHAEIAEYLAVMNSDDPNVHRAWFDNEPARKASTRGASRLGVSARSECRSS